MSAPLSAPAWQASYGPSRGPSRARGRYRWGVAARETRGLTARDIARGCLAILVALASTVVALVGAYFFLYALGFVVLTAVCAGVASRVARVGSDGLAPQRRRRDW